MPEVLLSDEGQEEAGAKRRAWDQEQSLTSQQSLHDDEWKDKEGGFCHCRLRNKILCHLGSTLTSGVLICVVVVIGLLAGESPKWMESTTKAIETEELRNLDRVATEKAAFISSLLGQVEQDTKLIHRWSSMILNGVSGENGDRDDINLPADSLSAHPIKMFSCASKELKEGGGGADTTSSAGDDKFHCCCETDSDKGNVCPSTTGDRLKTADTSCCMNYGSWFYPGKYSTTNGDADSPYQSFKDGGTEVDDWAGLVDKNGDVATDDGNSGQPTRAALLKFANFELPLKTLMHQKWGSHDLTVGVYFGAENGLFRNYPFSMCNHYADPPKKWREDQGAVCYNSIGNKCPTNQVAYPSKPGEYCVYDPRCRIWYQLGKCDKAEMSDQPELLPLLEMSECTGTDVDDGKVFWTTPYVATTGTYQVGAVAPLYDSNGKLYGVFGNDIEVEALGDVINKQEDSKCRAKEGKEQSVCDEHLTDGKLDKSKCEADTDNCDWVPGVKLSENGYVYAFDFDGRLLVHKNYTSIDINESGTELVERENWQMHAEGWSKEEKDAWIKDVLQAKIQQKHPDTDKYHGQSEYFRSTCSNSHYISKEACEEAEETWTEGEKWWLSWAISDVGEYVVAATVPDSDIQAPAVLVNGLISEGIIGAIIAFSVVAIIIILIIFFVSTKFANKIVIPVQELGTLCDNINNGELDGEVDGEDAASDDVRQLKEAFRGMIVGLRFGSKEYREGNQQNAQRCFMDALELYEKLNNPRGIGVAKNNLAAVYMHCGKMNEAIELYESCIASARKLAEEAGQNGDEDNQSRHQKAMSDRKGNYAVLRMEQKNYEEAEKLLREALEIDQNIENYLGFAIKSGTLGQIYLKTDMHQNAEEAFTTARNLLESEEVQDHMKQFSGEAAIDFAIAKQHVMCNMGDLAKSNTEYQKARTYYVETLETYAQCDLGVQRRCLVGLGQVYEACGQADVYDDIKEKMKGMGGMDQAAAGPRDIALILDYSGSMAGGKHRAAMRNLKTIFDQHINLDDSVMFIHFSSQVTVDFTLMPKEGNEEMMHKAFDRLNMPGGSTAFYDACDQARVAMANSPNRSNQQWIIALTDGDDNRSQHSINEVKDNISNSNIDGLIVLAVGNDVSTADDLEALATASPKGQLIKAGASEEEITAAFAQAITAISGHIVLEDYN